MSSSRRHVGLDIGATALRAVEVHHSTRQGRYVVRRASSVSLPAGAILNGRIMDAPGVVRALKRLWRKGGFSTRRVVFGLTDANVITRQMDLPWLPEKEFRSALRFQVGDALPVDLETMELDCVPLAEFTITDAGGQEQRMSQVLLAATETEPVATTANTLIQARLEPVGADTTAFALVRTARAGILPPTGAARAIVDIGGDMSTVIVESGGTPRFIRSVVGQGGGIIVDTLAAGMQLSTADATALLIETGLNGPPPIVTPIAESSVFSAFAEQAEAPSPVQQRAMALISPWATDLVQQVRDSFDYYSAANPTSPISGVWLCGRTGRLSGMAERMTTELGLPTGYLDPWAELGRTLRLRKADSSGYGVATGLAMSTT